MQKKNFLVKTEKKVAFHTKENIYEKDFKE